MKYKYILFDADNTLYDFDKSESEALSLTMKGYGIKITPEQNSVYHEINDRLWKMLERGEVSRAELKTRRFAEFLEFLGAESADTPENVANSYVGNLALQTYPVEGADDVCRILSEKYPLYLITNGLSFVQRSRISRSPLSKYFTGVFISEEMGCSKPDLSFFTQVAEAVGDSDARNYIVIGDSLSSDIQGAVNFGSDSVWINRTGANDPRPTYTVTDLTDILGIL